MRDWSTKQTADWWAQADQNYRARGENQPSEDYLLSHASFDSILEIGSGTGRLIQKLGGRRGAIDINSHMLAKLDSSITKYNIDISEKLITDKYDLVFSYQVLQHLPHDKFVKALENMKAIATKEVWLLEGQVAGWPDGSMTHITGSYHHDYEKYLNCYQIDEMHGGKIKIFRGRV